jgi:hypothetical protein
MDVLAECACEQERRDLEQTADHLFAALAACVPDSDDDAFELLAMPEPYAGKPQPLPTLEETIVTATLPPPAKRQAWTEADDEHLLALFHAHGARWRRIARDAQSPRSDDAVRNRVARLTRRAATPPADKSRARAEGAEPRRPWAREEDARLLELVRTTRAWSEVARAFVRRTPHACRNRVFRLTGQW